MRYRHNEVTANPETRLILSRHIRCLLLVSATAWGLPLTSAAAVAIDEKPLSALIGDLQRISPAERDETLSGIDAEMAAASQMQQEKKREWLRQQWAELTVEQRGQLRAQIREHRQRQHEERQRPQSPLPEPVRDERPQKLSPEERQEFRQWMHERRNDAGLRDDVGNRR